MLLIDSILSATVYSNLFSGESNLARCLVDWFYAVPILDIIGRIETQSIVPVGAGLCFLAVP